MISDSILWKKRYDSLASELQALHEKVNGFKTFFEVPNEPISTSDTFFISNDLEVCDNEEAALDHWGPGKYFKVVKVKNDSD